MLNITQRSLFLVLLLLGCTAQTHALFFKLFSSPRAVASLGIAIAASYARYCDYKWRSIQDEIDHTTDEHDLRQLAASRESYFNHSSSKLRYSSLEQAIEQQRLCRQAYSISRLQESLDSESM